MIEAQTAVAATQVRRMRGRAAENIAGQIDRKRLHVNPARDRDRFVTDSASGCCAAER
jgi:hypothetical protein